MQIKNKILTKNNTNKTEKILTSLYLKYKDDKFI